MSDHHLQALQSSRLEFAVSIFLIHKIKTSESLEITIKADSKLIQRLKTLSKKRNATSYDSAGNVSAQELELAIKTATELRRNVIGWLDKNHPALRKN